jgi:hypothetical protein
MTFQGILRRKKKLLFLGGLAGTKTCCCDCCVYEGECIKRQQIPDGECDHPYDIDAFNGTVTVSWCGLSITFRLEDRPGPPNYAIATGPVDTGYEQACGTTIFNGTEFDVTYKNEQAWIYILGGGYDPTRFPDNNPVNASSDCLRMWFPIVTRLQGQLTINDGTREIFLDYAPNDQEQFVFFQDICRRSLLTRVPGGGNGCNNDPNHLHCRTDPVVTINEAE